MNNPLTNTRIEFHILQSFPVTCLNRDDVGAPKTAVIGGVSRARVSSQCWKRQVRLQLHELGVTHGTRTKLLSKLIEEACAAKGATEEQAKACGDKFEQIFIKKKDDKKNSKKNQEADNLDAEAETATEKSDTLLFLSPNEVKILAEAFADKDFNPDLVITQKDVKKQGKEVAALIRNVNQAIDAVDIALFGRMVAQAADLSVEAATSFAHAISTHKASNEVEFFTALDDSPESELGAAHMGSLEFNSATYYRYVSLDLGQLYQTLAGQNLPEAVAAFTKALYLAVPAARQATQSGYAPWGYAKILVRKGQRVQVSFDKPIKPEKEEGYLIPSIIALDHYLTTKEKQFGSLFGKIAEYTLADDTDFNIDNLVDKLQTHAGDNVNA